MNGQWRMGRKAYSAFLGELQQFARHRMTEHGDEADLGKVGGFMEMRKDGDPVIYDATLADHEERHVSV